MEKTASQSIEKAKNVSTDDLKAVIKSENPKLYDQLLIVADKRTDVFYNNYSAKTFIRKAYKYTFPLKNDVVDLFKVNFLKSSQSDLVKIEEENIFDKIDANKEEISSLNEKKLLFCDEIKIIAENNLPNSKQPKYYIPELTKSKTCNTCSGEKYLQCSESECRGQHIYDCYDCQGHGETTCESCDGRHEYTCPTCHGKGEITCGPCSGKGQVECNSCDGDGYKKVNDGRTEKKVCSKRCGNGWVDCSSCRGTGLTKCKFFGSENTITGAAFRSAIGKKKEFCKGKGTIVCNKCKPNGKIDCDTCEASGKLTCEVCYGDHEENRYGKVDCVTCKTAGKLGILTTVETQINDKTYSNPTLLLEEYKDNQLKSNDFTPFVEKKAKKEIYSWLNGHEESHYDNYSKDLSETIRKSLEISTDKYPKILKESIEYTCIPISRLTYNHILSGTTHELSVIGIHLNNPKVIFHSDPTKVEVEKGIEKNAIKNIIGKAFTTKSYKKKTEKRNELILLIHLAKADGEIEDSEKQILAKNILDLNDFTNKEKKELFDTMSSDTLPKLDYKNAIFYSDNSANQAILKLKELGEKADGKFETAEKEKIGEIEELIQIGKKKKKGILLNFVFTWQISIPFFLLLGGGITTVIWFLLFNPESISSENINKNPVSENEKTETTNDDGNLQPNKNTTSKNEDEANTKNVVDVENEDLNNNKEIFTEPTIDIQYYKISDPDGYSNLRKTPGGEIMQKVNEGELFEVIGEENKHKKVKLKDGTIGYIHVSRVVQN
ncbi:MAG: TerB family tellurite resistance protein [Crocinitomicaceae bacterium]